ncbi:MAG TPA: hypothetical protein VL595_37015 [Pseudonocardia sp.]|nr:hypothetical protein [Pseudonocardia sp.]
MAGWLPVRRVPRERPATPLRGHKLAHPMVSSDGTRVGFGGVTLGRASVYGVIADAECAQGGRHRSPSRWCDCGFYCVHTLDDARALACDPDYRYAVLLDVVVSGRYMRYERGLRYARQRVTAVRVGRCACGGHARMFVEASAGTAGWRRLVAVCASCAGTRAVLSFGWLSRMLAGVPVIADPPSGVSSTTEAPDLVAGPAGPGATTGASPAAAETAAAVGTETAPAPALSRVGEPPALSEVPAEALVPLLTAEVTLLQARLDEVQRQLARLTPE